MSKLSPYLPGAESSTRLSGGQSRMLGLVQCCYSLWRNVTETWLAMNLWSGRWSAASWRTYLEEGITDSNLGAIRRSTYSGRPLGSAEFTRTLEKETKRRLTPQKRGPKKKTDTCDRQETFSFDA
jgi:hypothetical protein